MKRHHNNGAGARPSTPRRQEQGYVLVLLILMVALVFVSFSAIIPKVFFEAQRDREEELYFRGMQYQHAIQLFFRKFGRYPNSIDELEKTNGIRFLRKRYSDPITMKKEWRLIHVGANGQFVDAKTTITAAPVVAGQPGGTTPSQSATPGGQPGGSNSFSQPGLGSGQPASQTPGFGVNPSPSGFGGSGLSPAGQTPGGQPITPGSNPPTDPALTPSANPGANPLQTRGLAGSQQTPGASNVVGGTTSNTPSSQSGSNPSPVFGGGAIAGVASLSEASSIRVIKTYDEYDKWEFIYDFHSDPVAMAAVARTAGAQPQPQQGTPPGSAPPGTPNVTPPGMFPSPNQPNPFGLTPGASPPPRTK
jgi:type II secretory pathway pseudopilin PulG